VAQRAAALEAVADALDDRAAELAVIADTETALGGERLTGEVARPPSNCACSQGCSGTVVTSIR
jgi:acyl-CoA reductase-like NAD-dependent aldehyde dehydrogenase